MTNLTSSSSTQDAGGWRNAARFWESLRPWYNGVLFLAVAAWVTLTWPHFRADLSSLLLWLLVFLVGANIFYCAAYAAELFVQSLIRQQWWRRVRQSLWLMGMLFSLLVENYWIADEIYPYPNQGPKAANLVGGVDPMSTVHFASNLNFPAPLAVLGFLAAFGGLAVAAVSILVFWFARKPKLARRVAIAIGGGFLLYFALLLGFSGASQTKTLSVGQEKYFCEIDCHLAYSVLDVKKRAQNAFTDYSITLRTRFDESTISPNQPKDAPLMPSPREVRIVDGTGREFAPTAAEGTPLMTALKPGESYNTQLTFRVPRDAGGLRLLLRTTPAWPDHVVIGDENSWLHKKTYFAL